MAYVSVAGEMNYQQDAVSGSFQIGHGSRIEKVERLSVDDLNAQQDGELTMLVGAKTGENTGGVRVIRYLALYTAFSTSFTRFAKTTSSPSVRRRWTA